MSRENDKKQVLSLFESWLGARAAFPLEPGASEDDEIELRFFDWDRICDEAKMVMLESIFNDSKPDDFAGLRKDGRRRNIVLEDNWLPIAIVHTGPVPVRGYDEPDYFPQFSQLLLVNLDELRGKDTPLYRLDISGTAVPSKTVPRDTVAGVAQTLGNLELCAPVTPEEDE